MGVLLDTHVLLWAASDTPRLSSTSRRMLADPRDVHFSVVNIWEIVIRGGKLGLRFDAESVRRAALAAGLSEIPVRGHHVLAVARLPHLHRDPFDRILLAQAAAEGLKLLTVDARVLAYGEPAQQA